MRQRILSAAMALAIAFSLLTFASAAEVQRHEVPVTLTVVNTERKISVTVPAALPVSLVDGDVVTATNAAITNQAQTGSIRVTGVSVLPAEYAIGDYTNFSGGRGTIALSLNGCPTRGEGPLALEADGFPAIPAGRSLAIQYDAKVAPEEKPDAVTAATVVFTIAAAE